MNQDIFKSYKIYTTVNALRIIRLNVSDFVALRFYLQRADLFKGLINL